MEEKNFAMETEFSVRLDRLIYIILRSWRRILRTGIVIALLGAVLVSISTAAVFCSEERRAKVENEYDMALFSHEIEGKNLEIEIQNLYESIQQQETYNANSILMQIDPYNKYVATMTYYVDTGYQIMPAYQYQNIDYGPRLVQMYAEYLTGGEMYSEVAEGFSAPNDVRFIEELFEISTHHSMGMVEIQVCAVSQMMCQEIIDILSQGMNAKHAEAVQLIGNHSLTELNKNISVVVDTLLDETQKQNIQAITNATIVLEEKQETLEAWEREAPPAAPFSLESIVKSVLKAMIIGAVVGVLLITVIETICYISGDRIIGTSEFRDRCAVPVLGELPEQGKKKCWMDRWIDRIGKVTFRSSDAKILAAVAAENICMVAENEHKTIALIGSIPLEDFEPLRAEFQSSVEGKLRFLVAGNPLICSSSASIVSQADAVVLIEKQGYSTYADVINECQRMNSWGMSVLGIVFTNVDAIME